MKRLIYLAWLPLLLLSSSILSAQESASGAKFADDKTASSSLAIAASDRSTTATQSTWLIVRHAEKDADSQLTEAGKRRAEKLKKLANLFRIKAVYATDYPRTQDTAKPTAVKIGVEVQKYPPKPDVAWFAEMKTKHAGQAVLIVGHSNTVDKLVTGLGGKGGFSISEDEYDNLFIVTINDNTATSLRLSYGNMAEDE